MKLIAEHECVGGILKITATYLDDEKYASELVLETNDDITARVQLGTVCSDMFSSQAIKTFHLLERLIEAVQAASDDVPF